MCVHVFACVPVCLCVHMCASVCFCVPVRVCVSLCLYTFAAGFTAPVRFRAFLFLYTCGMLRRLRSYEPFACGCHGFLVQH